MDGPPRPRGPLRDAVAIVALVTLLASAASAGAGSQAETALATTTPGGGSTVSGTIDWRIGASGSVPKAVVFSVDGTVVGRDRSAPFATRLDTTRLVNGTHRLVARAEARPRTKAPETGVTVSVANATGVRAPSVVSAPTITGIAVVGETLTAQPGTWSGTTPLTHAYSWSRCGSAGDGCTVAESATARTFLVDGTTVGRSLRVSVTTTNAGGAASAASAPTAVVVAVPIDSCARPYTADSPWNTPVGPAATVLSGSLSGVLGDDTLSSEPLQYAFPVYEVDASVQETAIVVEGVFSNVTDGGTVLRRTIGGASVRLRLPVAASASDGSDAHLVVVDPATGDEWGFWQATKDGAGNWSATNGYHYNTRWSGVAPTGFGSRGAGVPYLAGLVRACEIARGRIDHALAFGYDYPRDTFVYPATKSDGKSTSGTALPEGARLQLDPTLSDDTIRSWGCTGSCLAIAHAMQTYGMYVVDNAGRDKVFPEDERTARWSGTVTRNTLSVIPKSHLRWISGP